jgi:DNA-binding NarL/FixJ family response regulator
MQEKVALVIDNEAALLHEWRNLLMGVESLYEMATSASEGTAKLMMFACNETPLHCVIVDSSVLGDFRAGLIQTIKEFFPGAGIIVIGRDLADAEKMLSLQEQGVLLLDKPITSETLFKAIELSSRRASASNLGKIGVIKLEQMLFHKLGMSKRESQIFARIIMGLSQKEIASLLELSTTAVSTYIRRGLAKTSCRTPSQVLIALKAAVNND